MTPGAAWLRFARTTTRYPDQGTTMADTMDDIRRKAAAAVFALGQRSASKGRMEAEGAPKAGWMPSPGDAARGYIHTGKLREALAYYDIALSILAPGDPNGSFTLYTKALLLEEIGDYADAEAAFRSLQGSPYESPAQLGVKRCAQRRAGSYDARAEMRMGFEHLAQTLQDRPGAAYLLAAMQHVQEALMAQPDSRADHAHAAAQAPKHETPSDADEEAAAEFAQRFVDLLLDRDYSAARQWLHADLARLTPGDLKASFEALFAEEPFPESAHVFDALRDWPAKRAGDIASFYVTIESENAEAVSVIVARDGGGALKVRDIEWGRP